MPPCPASSGTCLWSCTVNVRKLTEDDDLTLLVTAGLAEGFTFMARLAREHTQGDFARPGALLLGVFEGEFLLGVGGVTPDPYTPDLEVGRIRHVYVLLKARRRGAARLLLENLVASAPSHYTRLRLRTPTERGAAFYRACGFADTDEPNATHTLTCR